MRDALFSRPATIEPPASIEAILQKALKSPWHPESIKQLLRCQSMYTFLEMCTKAHDEKLDDNVEKESLNLMLLKYMALKGDKPHHLDMNSKAARFIHQLDCIIQDPIGMYINKYSPGM